MLRGTKCCERKETLNELAHCVIATWISFLFTFQFRFYAEMIADQMTGITFLGRHGMATVQ